MPATSGRFDLAVIALTAAALLAWVLVPEGPAIGAALLLAGMAQAARLARWHGIRTISAPIVLVLHLAYGWISLGLLLLGASGFTPAMPSSAALHALTVGAMGSMTLAVMTRATLGHTGRDLTAGPATVLIYALITLAALLRVAAPALPVPYIAAIHTAASCWIGAFLLFALVYGRMLLARRADSSA